MRLTRDEIVAKGPLGRRADPFLYVLACAISVVAVLALLRWVL